MKANTILPPGFDGVLVNLIAAKQAAQPPKPTRRGLLADVQRDVALGKNPPLLQFASAVNYTYNRHAEALYGHWLAREAAALEAYPINGKNTYARALARYRDLLLANLREAS